MATNGRQWRKHPLAANHPFAFKGLKCKAALYEVVITSHHDGTSGVLLATGSYDASSDHPWSGQPKALYHYTASFTLCYTVVTENVYSQRETQQSLCYVLCYTLCYTPCTMVHSVFHAVNTRFR